MHQGWNEAASPAETPSQTGSVLDVIVDELTEQFGRGETPELDGYIARYPQFSGQLRNAFQALRALRQRGNVVAESDSAQNAASLNGQLGDFRLLREIGHGGMGVVYEAEQISLRRRVALKALPFAAVLDGRQLQRFKNEAQAAAGLEHPNIVDVYAVGCDRGVHFYAMKYIEGQTLAQLIAEVRLLLTAETDEQTRQDRDVSRITQIVIAGRTRRYQADDGSGNSSCVESNRSVQSVDLRFGEPIEGRNENTNGTAGRFQRSDGSYSWLSRSGSDSLSSTNGNRQYYRSVARIGVQAAQALEHAHQMGVVHRDIKPSNLMLDADGHLWITDFGLAMFEANPDLTMTGMILGTLRYMSPEQMRGERAVLDHRTDVYSLGATLYELLALQPAFPEDNPQRLLNDIPNHDPPSPRRVRPDVPADLAVIVSKAMSKDPADRYVSAKEFAEDLTRFLDDRPIRARRPTVGEIAMKWMRRNTAVVGLCIALLAIATVGLCVSTWLILGEQNRVRSALVDASNNYREAEKQRHRAERAVADLQKQAQFTSEMSYAADIRLAAGAWRNGDSVQQTELLSRYIPIEGRPDVRGFEWHYLWQQASMQHADVINAGQPLYCARFSPDGNSLAAAGRAGAIRIFSASDWSELRAIDTGQGEVNGVAFDPAGTQLVSAGDDGTLRIWNMATGHQIREIRAHERFAYQVAFSSNGHELISCGKEPVIRAWDPRSGEAIGTFEGHEEAVEAISVSPDGNLLGSASSDGTVAIWNLQTRKKMVGMAFRPGRVVCATFSSDSRLFAAGNTSGRVAVWEISDLNKPPPAIFIRGPLDAVRGPGDGVQSVSFWPGGPTLVAGDRGGGIRRWHLRLSESVWNATGIHWLGHEGRVYDTAFSSSGDRIVSAGEDGALKVWNNTERSRWLPLADDAFDDFAISRGGSLLVAVGKTSDVNCWNLQTGEHFQVPTDTTGTWRKIALSENEIAIALGNDEGEIVCTQLPAGSELWRRRCSKEARICELAFSPNGLFLAALLWPSDNFVHLYEGSTGNELAKLPARQCEVMAFSADSTKIAAGDWNQIAIYDTSTGQRVDSLLSRADTIKKLEFSPCGDWLASCGTDRRLVVWDLETGKERFSQIAHPGEVKALSITADGRTIVTAGEERTTRLWSVPTEQLLFEFPPENKWYSKVALSANDHQLLCLDSTGIIRIYDAAAFDTGPAQADSSPAESE